MTTGCHSLKNDGVAARSDKGELSDKGRTLYKPVGCCRGKTAGIYCKNHKKHVNIPWGKEGGMAGLLNVIAGDTTWLCVIHD